MRKLGEGAVLESGDFENDSPDPTRYHAGKGGAVMLPIADRHGVTPKTPRDPRVLLVDPGVPNAQSFAVDLDKITPELSRRAALGDPLSSLMRLSQETKADPQMATYRPSFAGTVKQAAATSPDTYLVGTATAPAARPLVEPTTDELLQAARPAPPVARPVTAAPIGNPEPTNPLAAVLPLLQLLQGQPLLAGQFPPAQPVEVSNPSKTADQEAAPNCGLQFLTVRPSRPKRRVIFRMATGTISIGYHAVLVDAHFIVLVTDTRDDQNMQYLPPDTEEPIFVEIDGQTHQVTNGLGIRFALGVLDFLVLYEKLADL